MRSRLLATSLAVVLLVGACGGDDDDTGSEATSTSAGATSTAAPGTTTAATAAPEEEGCTAERKGGEVTIIPSSVINPLDPITALGASRGYHELAAIYDMLMYRDPETGEFVPQLAESLEPNA